MKSTEMWSRNDFEDGLDIYKTGSSASSPGWVPGCESAWHGSSSIGGSNRARRHSAASDSADTGIGTSCSDSVEDHSSSSGTLSFQPLRSQGFIPTAHVMPSPSSTKLSVTQSVPGSPWNSGQLSSPVSGPLDMKDPRPVRRWSSLTRLSGQEKSGRTQCHPDAHGSLDRSLLHARAESSPLKPGTLDLSYSALPESRASPATPRGHSLGHQAVGGSPIQPSVRTQMWLSEQMEFRPEGMSAWLSEQQQRDRMRQEAELSQMLAGTSLPVNTLVKIKEGLLRQRELEIDRQKQQILQLHARIRENELRAQQVLQNQRGRCDDSYVLKSKESPMDSPASSLHSPQPPPLCCENGELARRLASSELEILHLKEFLKQNTQKYTEDIKKLEEKMKTRDRYISSLKKKCQREQEQNQEKQQRIETLEKYLADLPSLDEVHTQAQQLEEVQAKVQTLQETAAQLERSLEESRTQLQEKDALIDRQAKREKELMAAVQSLQEKVEECLEDGVRLPMLDLKQLEQENTRLLEQQSHSSTLIAGQKQQIDTLTLELTALEKRLQKEKAFTQELHQQLVEREEDLKTLSKSVQQKQQQQQHVNNGAVLQEASALLKEMSLCLLDLKALCSILTQRAQGKEPNLALLLGIKSMSCSPEDSEAPAEDGVQAKLLEVRQLRNDIDELRTIISDRYAQDMGENCVTQ